MQHVPTNKSILPPINSITVLYIEIWKIISPTHSNNYCTMGIKIVEQGSEWLFIDVRWLKKKKSVLK
jgi:hypothetical protein